MFGDAIDKAEQLAKNPYVEAAAATTAALAAGAAFVYFGKGAIAEEAGLCLRSSTSTASESLLNEIRFAGRGVPDSIGRVAPAISHETVMSEVSRVMKPELSSLGKSEGLVGKITSNLDVKPVTQNLEHINLNASRLGLQPDLPIMRHELSRWSPVEVGTGDVEYRPIEDRHLKIDASFLKSGLNRPVLASVDPDLLLHETSRATGDAFGLPRANKFWKVPSKTDLDQLTALRQAFAADPLLNR
jgi:hypothetical protein